MTFFETASQARAFLLLLYAGFAAGVLYDVLGLVRRRLPWWGQIPLDVLWCLLAALCCAVALALGGEGQARLYALLGGVCGGSVYCLGVRRLFLAIAGLFQGKKNAP